MRILLFSSRLLVSILFIVSGLIKANDTIGFSYKLEEYFEVFGMDWLSDSSLLIAASICILEILLGVMLLIGSRIKFTSWSLLLMILFFTFLTFFSAYFNKVTDCGCFGDALKITPWQSFFKDLVLLFLIFIVFVNRNKIEALFSKKAENIINIFILILCTSFVWHTFSHLPAKDFRPYAIGENISEGMKSCDELGLPCTEQASIYIVKDKQSKQLLEMNANDWISQMDRYEYIEATDKVVLLVDGYEPPIHDFSITTLDGHEITDSILQIKEAYLVVAYDISTTNAEASKKLSDLYLVCQEKGIAFVALSASSDKLIEEFSHENNIMFPYHFTDETTLKTIIRSNPGLVQIEAGTIKGKWHFNDFPSTQKLVE